LKKARIEAGFAACSHAISALGLDLRLGEIERGNRPVFIRGRWSRTASRIAMMLGKLPEEIWPEEEAQYVLPALAKEQAIERLIPNPEELLELKQEQDRMRQVFDLLNSKYKCVITMHFGIDTEEHSLDAIGEVFGVSRERARQLILNVLSACRDGPISRFLQGEGNYCYPFQQRPHLFIDAPLASTDKDADTLVEVISKCLAQAGLK
jgi:hypothetical protein